MSDELGKTRIVIPIMLDGEVAGGESVEAVRLCDGVYRIEQIPAMVDHRYGDIVLCDESDPSKLPTMLEVIEPSGMVLVNVHMTPKGLRNIPMLLDAIRKTGAIIERIEGKFFAINTPPDTIERVTETLDEYHAYLSWWFDDDSPPGLSVTPPS